MKTGSIALTALGLPLLLSGCGGMRSTGAEAPSTHAVNRDPAPAYRQEAHDLVSDQDLAIARLSEIAEAVDPDCGSACQLVDHICDLGERICQISARHIADSELEQQCQAATRRCEGARSRAERCECVDSATAGGENVSEESIP